MNKIHNFFRGFGVEISSWLIGQNYRWITHEGARYCYALLLTTRKFMRKVGHPITQPNTAKELGCLFHS